MRTKTAESRPPGRDRDMAALSSGLGTSVWVLVAEADSDSVSVSVSSAVLVASVVLAAVVRVVEASVVVVASVVETSVVSVAEEVSLADSEAVSDAVSSGRPVWVPVTPSMSKRGVKLMLSALSSSMISMVYWSPRPKLAGGTQAQEPEFGMFSVASSQ